VFYRIGVLSKRFIELIRCLSKSTVLRHCVCSVVMSSCVKTSTLLHWPFSHGVLFIAQNAMRKNQKFISEQYPEKHSTRKNINNVETEQNKSIFWSVIWTSCKVVFTQNILSQLFFPYLRVCLWFWYTKRNVPSIRFNILKASLL